MTSCWSHAERTKTQLKLQYSLRTPASDWNCNFLLIQNLFCLKPNTDDESKTARPCWAICSKDRLFHKVNKTPECAVVLSKYTILGETNIFKERSGGMNTLFWRVNLTKKLLQHTSIIPSWKYLKKVAHSSGNKDALSIWCTTQNKSNSKFIPEMPSMHAHVRWTVTVIFNTVPSILFVNTARLMIEQATPMHILPCTMWYHTATKQ